MTKQLGHFLRQIVDNYPITKSLINRVWNTYERVLYTSFNWINMRRYSGDHAEIDPYKQYEFKPEHINYYNSKKFDFLTESGRVYDGDWDTNVGKTIKKQWRYRSFHQRFVKGVSWEETEYYRSRIKKIQSDLKGKFVSVESLWQKFEQFEQMYESMKKEGYKTQAEIAATNNNFGIVVGEGGYGIFPETGRSLSRHEIVIDIGRNGRPLLNQGRHRLCMAKLLELNTVSVRIAVRHRQWQNIRNRVVMFVKNNSFSNEDEMHRRIRDEILSDEEIVLGLKHPDLLSVVQDTAQK